MTTELKYKDTTEKIIGASFEVHKFLGKGFQEWSEPQIKRIKGFQGQKSVSSA